MIFFTGIFVSIVHVFSGPDHLAAVTPLSIESKRKSWIVGVMWGLGHVIGMLILGLLFLLLRDVFPIEKISIYSELLVGVVLIVIGVWSIYKAIWRKRKHTHPHLHLEPKPHIHFHKHSHDFEAIHEHKHDRKVDKQNFITAFSVGTLHGFAGISHLIAFLPTLVLPNVSSSVKYLVGFAVGTISAMVIYSVILGIIGSYYQTTKNKKIFFMLRIFGGVAAISVGIFWILRFYY